MRKYYCINVNFLENYHSALRYLLQYWGIKFNHDCNVLSNGFVEDRERGQVHGKCKHKWQNVNNWLNLSEN